MPDKSSEHVKLGKPVRDGKTLATAKESYTPLAQPEQTGARLKGLNHYILPSTALRIRLVDAGAQQAEHWSGAEIGAERSKNIGGAVSGTARNLRSGSGAGVETGKSGSGAGSCI
jgi:hypothetical protein